MIAATAYNLKNMFNAKGRETRNEFLSYLVFVFLLNVVIYFFASAPTLVNALGAGMDAARSGDPASAQTAVLDQLIGFAGTLVWISLGLAVLNIILLSAAFVRRSHDAGLPGLVLAIPLGLQLVWMFFAYRQLDGLEQTMRSAAAAQMAGASPSVQTGMIAQDMIGWLVVLIVVVIGSMRHHPAADQFDSSDSTKEQVK